MNKYDYLDTTDSYSYVMDLSKIKLELPETSRKAKHQKRYICIDLEMTEFTQGQHYHIPGANGEVIQFGAVMLDENYNMISKFSSYVKPSFSSVTPVIHNLTGITNKVLENADDFITVFDKFNYWRGEGDITTFCWSKADHKQLWNELCAKGSHRYDLFSSLKDFVDLQEVFCSLISSKVSVSLESALKLLQMEYEGQVHTAYSDSFNTARILHKLFCTESLDLEYDYINPAGNKGKEEVQESCSFSSFMSPELLVRFGLSGEEKEAEKTFYMEEIDDSADLKLDSYNNSDEIRCLCEKYRVTVKDWIKLSEKVSSTPEMLIA